MSKTSPIILLVIVILAVVFFIFGLLQFLIRCLVKRPSFSSISQSNRFPETSGSHTFQRQLHQLFRLHDSGLDQALIDALPVFYYKDIVGLKEPFDCAVCLCEFSDFDKLKFIPSCGHAFHMHCIETWLLSNSTCPLCRGLISPGLVPVPMFNFNESMEQQNREYRDGENETFSCQDREMLRENEGEMRVFSVRLGKFRSQNEDCEIEDGIQSEISSSNLDARRCYSLGAFQYIVGDSDLRIALSNENGNKERNPLFDSDVGTRCDNGKFVTNADRDGQKISVRTRGDSFSVSKIWLWPRKDTFLGSSDTNVGASSSCIGMPVTNRTNAI
ncbi:RING-H2 finger protein ATL46 [Abeliophyllum distichum]|uniref:RING-type E3 ubiquitin transferase n=1 Tax=Abeliophyllum distichum TaxID=126358 RepID=A0ABD1VQ94_9LAMI